MNIPIYQIDAFTNKVFKGNPAAICPLKSWIDDDQMQAIALENNLAETAFFIKKQDKYHIRWFTPTVEMDLCGHATLAAAHVIFQHFETAKNVIDFESSSGDLRVFKEKDCYTLDFPIDEYVQAQFPKELIKMLNELPLEVYKGNSDLMVVLNNESEIKHLDPDLKIIAALPYRGVVFTAQGENSDFVSRFFAPQSGIDEDPVTGSTHTMLTPYWTERLGKKKLYARQLSKRTGELICSRKGERIHISGNAKTYMAGELMI